MKLDFYLPKHLPSIPWHSSSWNTKAKAHYGDIAPQRSLSIICSVNPVSGWRFQAGLDVSVPFGGDGNGYNKSNGCSPET